MTSRHTNSTKMILTTKTIAITVARTFLDHRLAIYDTDSPLYTDNGQQYVSTFFVAMCSTLSMNKISTT